MLAVQKQTIEMPISKLTLHKSVQMRHAMNLNAVQDYADLYAEGEELPPIVAFGRTGGPIYVADGFHRIEAKKRAMQKTIKVELHDGGRRDAMLYAMSANARHGVRRTNADKQKAIHACLSDKEWVKWTDTEIARHCVVSQSTVTRMRERMGEDARRDVRTFLDSKGNLHSISVPPKEDRRTTSQRDKEVFGNCPYCGRPMIGD